MTQENKPQGATNFFSFYPQAFTFNNTAPKPASFSFGGSSGNIKFEFYPPKTGAAQQKTEEKIHFKEIYKTEEDILIEKPDILYYILQEIENDNGEKVKQYVKGEKARVQLIKVENDVMLVARIVSGYQEASEHEGNDVPAVKSGIFERIVFQMIVESTVFEFDKFLKATGSNLMVRYRTNDQQLKPVVQTFLFKGEGVEEIYEKIYELKK